MNSLRVEDIQTATAEYFQLSLAKLLGRSQQREFARPRQIAMYLARALTYKSLPQIGVLFGGRDHSTVFHACRHIDDLITAGNEPTNAAVATLKVQLGEPTPS